MPTPLPRQFVLAQEPPPIPDGWAATRVAGLTLATDPLLPVTELVRPGGDAEAWVLGTVVDGDRLVTGGRIEMAAGEEPAGRVARMGGRHVAVVDGGDGPRLHLDAGGTLSAVYDPRSRRAGSTPAAILGEEYDARYDAALAAAVGMPDQDHWYPAGLTAHRGVERLLPNHCLDLTTWRPVRTWPGGGPPAPRHPEDAVAEIAAVARDALRAVADARGGLLSVTAGRDSRLLLACARDALDRFELFTFSSGEHSVDVHVARRLARRAGIAVRELRTVAPTPAQDEAWLRRTGHCVGGTIREIHPTLAELPPERVVMPGMAGEVARAYFWRAGDERAGRVEAADLVERLHLPLHERFVDAVAAWLAPLEGLPVPFVLDLAYVELRLGCWSGPQSYGSDAYGDTLVPLAHREIFEAMLALPEDYRRAEQLAVDVCREAWPELLELPFNRYTGTRRASAALRRQAGRAARVARYLRASTTSE
jgi:hypothetical protein